MQTIDANHVYAVGKYTLVNYIQVSTELRLLVLEWRNQYEVRRWMLNTDVISIDVHLSFIEKLKKQHDRCYWVVFEDQKPIGTINLTKIDLITKSAELGYYMAPEFIGSGDGFIFAYNAFLFAFEVIQIEKLYGIVNVRNKPAYLLADFFGCTFSDTEQNENDRTERFHKTYIHRADFLQDLMKKQDVSKFVTHAKCKRVWKS